MKLKLKVFFTNVSRIIRSFLFINMAWLLNTKAKAAEIMCYDTVQMDPPANKSVVNEAVKNEVANQVTDGGTMLCYSIVTDPEAVLSKKSFLEKLIDDPENVFFILVPLVLIIVGIRFVVKKRKKSNKNVKENTNKQDEKK